MDVLPIGSIVRLKNGNVKLMILNKKWQRKHGSFWRNLLKSHIVSV